MNSNHPLKKLGFSLGFSGGKLIYKHPTYRIEKIEKILRILAT